MAAAGGEHGKKIGEYLRLFKVPAPTESDKKRPLLAKYVNQYTARNTMDYFIHKDLSGFLRRELDFYIKNEVMRLDDIENAEAPTVESYLAKIKVLRKIAGKLIDFLAQLEDFQKKLWLKKKFVVETNYCITLDRVPEELYAEVSACDAQCDEWIRLFAIDEIQGDMHSPGFTRPLTVEFLKANNKLVLDTHFFDDSFKARLVASIENFDEQCDGLLIHSENFQALRMMGERYQGEVQCIYIDPPYNTGKDGFNYKDNYQHSSWATMIYDRILTGLPLQSDDSSIFSSIDDGEQSHLRELMIEIFGSQNFVNNVVWQKKYAPANDAKWLSDNHDFILIFAKDKHGWRPGLLDRSEKAASMYQNPDNDHRGIWMSGDLSVKTYSAAADYPITTPSGRVINPPVGSCWRFSKKRFEELVADNRVWFGPDSDATPRLKRFLSEVKEGVTPLTLWTYAEVGHNQEGKQELLALFDRQKGPSSEELSVTTPKPVRLVSRVVRVGDKSGKGLILDYFAGSGSTAHAVINLNRADNGTRKYILIEMGGYFDTILKPRVIKVIYANAWKDGKPTSRNSGISHCFKYLRLESYEDTLNNLRLDNNPQRKKAIAANPSLKQDYMLRYLLDVETRGSQSLLNIDAFADPTAYTLNVKKPGTDEYATRSVDLIETFNYLIGLRVLHTSVPQTFHATFKRITDPELPEDQHTKLVVDERIRQDEGGPWWFRKVEGWVPKDPANPNNGQREKVLIVWRKLTGNIEQDNLMLDEWFQKNRISTRDFEFDTIYVNGSNNLPNLKLDDESWKVRLIEEEFMKRMWNSENA
jgi:adenine-specific DNA-methyltransferase